MSDRLVLPDRLTPLHALGGPFPAVFQRGLRGSDGRGRDGESAGVQRDQGQLQAPALLEQEVLPRHPHVRKADDPVLERLQSHEVTAAHDLDALPVQVDDKRRDLLRLRIAGHHHEQLGDRAVGGPQLLAVEDVRFPVRQKALIAPAAHRGRYFFFCSSVPNVLSGCGTPID